MVNKIADNAAAVEIIALKALGFLTSDDDRLGAFMSLSGIGPGELKAGIGDPNVLAGILDHLLENESLLLEFAAWAELAPQAIVRARQKLPGAHFDS